MIVPSVIAPSPAVQDSDFAEGLKIKYPPINNLVTNQSFNFHFHVFNSTNGVPLKPADFPITCYFHLYNSTGSHIYVAETNETEHIFDFGFDVDGGNFSIPGYYSYIIQCNSSTQGDFDAVPLQVNEQGKEVSTMARIDVLTTSLYIFLIISVILFVGFLFYKTSPPIKYTLLILSLIFFLITMNILSISSLDENLNPNLVSFFDSFTAISFIFYWFAAGLLIIIWVFAFFNTWLLKRNMDAFRRYGL